MGKNRTGEWSGSWEGAVGRGLEAEVGAKRQTYLHSKNDPVEVREKMSPVGMDGLDLKATVNVFRRLQDAVVERERRSLGSEIDRRGDSVRVEHVRSKKV